MNPYFPGIPTTSLESIQCNISLFVGSPFHAGELDSRSFIGMIGGGVTEVHFVGYVPLAPTLLKLFLRLIINFILDILGECNNLPIVESLLNRIFLLSKYRKCATHSSNSIEVATPLYLT